MSKAHRLKPRKGIIPAAPIPLNFLLGCSETDVSNFQMARLAEVADARKELHTILDRLIDLMSAAALAEWFKANDRNALKHAIEYEETPIEWAQRLIRQQNQRSETKELIPLPKFDPSAAHLAAAMRYQKRNIAEGKCMKCPEPLDPNSVCHCTKHMTADRDRYHRKKGLIDAGSREYLYSGEISESTKGRHPNNLAALAMGREQRTRAFLAEQGIKPENAAISLKAATEALVKVMPLNEGEAMSQDELFRWAEIVTKTTGKKALNGLIKEGLVQRIGKGIQGDLFKYFETAKAWQKRQTRKSGSELDQLQG